MQIPPATQTAYQQALQQLYDSLNQAYWVASTIEAKDAIHGLAQAAYDILTALNQGALDTDTAQYATLKTNVDAVNAKLTAVQAQINSWIHVIALATQLTGAIDKALGLAAKVFPV